MPRVEFEPTIQASERAKRVHALYSEATVTGVLQLLQLEELTTFVQIMSPSKFGTISKY
jgi:hypothetical protein